MTIEAGDVIPAERVADLTNYKPELDEEVMLVADEGLFWGSTLKDGSFRIERRVTGS
jgi:hypothetical protein